jgi:hypothetical protein
MKKIKNGKKFQKTIAFFKNIYYNKNCKNFPVIFTNIL